MPASQSPAVTLALLPAPELATQAARLQRRAARKVEDARARLADTLTRIAQAATTQAARCAPDAYLDASAIRQLCDPSTLADAFAEVRAAEMMAATVAEFCVEPGN